MKQGSGYLGSSAIETSVANQEILPSAPAIWTQPYSLYKFSLYNDDALSLSINGETAFYLRAGQGFQMDQNDKEITSVKITSNGKNFSWVGAY